MDNKIIAGLAEQAQRNFEESLAQAVVGIRKPNILLLGRTGAGKSSLLNLTFGRRLATESATAPQTRGFVRYSLEGVPVNIIDSEGIELEGEDAFRRRLADFLADNFADINRQVHICWYCISIGTNRVLDFDLAVLRLLLENNIPVAVVLTQADLDTPEGSVAAAMTAVIRDRFSADLIPVFQTSTVHEVNMAIGDLERLVQWSTENIPDANLRLGFIAAQCVSLAAKEKAAARCIAGYVATAGGVGAVPLPVSDSVVLTGLQMKMSADIYAIYGFDMTLRHGLQDFIQGKIASKIGKLAAGTALKAIPGAGQAVGSIVNASVASAVTYALGRTLSAACAAATKAAWHGDKSAIDTIFTAERFYDMFENFRNKFDKDKPENAND